jgi:hypothetical protein
MKIALWFGRARLGISVALCAALVASTSEATVFSIDTLSVRLNGQQLFVDGFGDGNPPPSAPNYQLGPSDPASYSLIGSMTESGGRGFLDAVSTGVAVPNVLGSTSLVTQATLMTPIGPTQLRTLGEGRTFAVSGIYDLTIPGHRSEDYRIRLSDRHATGDASKDSLDLRVQRFADAGGTAQVYVTFNRANYQNKDLPGGGFELIERTLLDLTGNPDQIRLTLAKADANSNAITASFAYLKNGAVISTTTFTQTANIFQDVDHTRASLVAQVLQGVVAPTMAAQLQTGSPTSISQTVSTPAAPFNLSFDYQFETTFGTLEVAINDVVIGTFSAPATLSGVMTTANLLVDNPALLGLTDAILRFTLDGDTGARILLDNVVGLALANASFQTGNLTGWLVTASGAGFAGVADLTPIPVPAALPLFATGLGGMALLGWWRRRRAAVGGASV